MGIRERFKPSSFTDYCLAVFTFLLVVVAIKQIVITHHQLGVMQIEQRAWIEVRPQGSRDNPELSVFKVELIEGQPIVFPLKIFNTGKTPAKNFDLVVFVEVANNLRPPHLECVDGSNSCPEGYWGFTGGIVPPNPDIDFPASRIGKSGEVWVASKAEVDAWNNGKSYIAAYGIVKYTDVFNVSHWTRFCFHAENLIGQATLTSSCAQHNSEDDN